MSDLLQQLTVAAQAAVEARQHLHAALAEVEDIMWKLRTVQDEAQDADVKLTILLAQVEEGR